MFSLLDKVPNENTYIAIGSAPHTTVEKYTDKQNQIFPLFIREMGGSWTLINIDPEFERPEKQEFVDVYLRQMGFVKQGQFRYRSSTVDAIFIPTFVEDKERDNILGNISKKVIDAGKKLVVQQYTGHELLPAFERFYKTLSPKEFDILKKNVIWDVTYGRDCSCMTDMSVWKPILLEDGFLNLACMTDDELIALIGKSAKIDELISYRFKKEYRRLIDVHHVNYRRRIKGLENYMHAEYGNSATPEQIMEIFSAHLYPVMRVLKKVHNLSEEKYAEQLDMINNYHLYDVYKWYSFMCGIYA
jgi:hypothetical protein